MPAIPEDADPPADDPAAVAEAWRAEIARRIEDVRVGRVQLLDAEGSAERIRRALDEARRK